MVCDWCDGAGCDECAGAPKGGSGGGGGAVCDWCDGAGCDECATQKQSAGGKKVCDWCEGAGCDECAIKTKKAKGPCDWCDGAGCEVCTGAGGGGDDEDEFGGGGGGGSCDFCGGEGCQYCSGVKEEINIDVHIANAFYEAESDVKENPKKAREYFEKVIELSKSGEALNEESQDTVFNAMVWLVMFMAKDNDPTVKCIEMFDKVVAYFSKVSHNESSKAIDTILNELASAKKYELRETIYTRTLDTLNTMSNKARMIFDLQMRRCTEYVAEQSYDRATELLRSLHQLCLLPDGTDDAANKGSELIDIYALEMKIAFETKTVAKTKELYEKTKDLTAAVKNPKSQSIIKECWGKMFGDDGQWQEAYGNFFNAFITYQEAGQTDRAKTCLTFLVIANMLAGDEHNPFGAREVKVFERDESMQPVINLRKAFEKRDVISFNTALAEFSVTADEWLLGHMEVIIADFHKQYILKFVKPYRRLRINGLAEALNIPPDKCERYLVQLVLDGNITGKIDQVEGLLDLTQRTGGGDKKYQALEGWIGNLDNLTRNLPQPSEGPFRKTGYTLF